MKRTILMIDDDKELVRNFIELSRQVFEVIPAYTGEDGLAKFSEVAPDAVLLDLKLGCGKDGLEVLKEMRAQEIEAPVIVITDYPSPETAFEAGRLGAYFYTGKVPRVVELVRIIEDELKNHAWRRHSRQERHRRLPAFIGESPAIKELWRQVERIARLEVPVLITGETGTGKEIIANAIHERSRRHQFPLYTVNCSNLQPDRFESDFFGHEKGSYTGAFRPHKGQFENADGSSFFMDEVGDLPLESQPKLLRAIEYKTFQRLGSTVTREADVRIIAATHRHLEDAVARGAFRKDLFYRLTPVMLHLPPLRQRRDDIPLLVNHFVEKYAQEFHLPVPKIPDRVMEFLQNYDWPGNIRQLQNILQAALICSEQGTITLQSVPMRSAMADGADPCVEELRKLPFAEAKKRILDHFQRDYVYHALMRCNWNITRCAEEIGIHRATLHQIIKEAGWKGPEGAALGE